MMDAPPEVCLGNSPKTRSRRTEQLGNGHGEFGSAEGHFTLDMSCRDADDAGFR